MALRPIKKVLVANRGEIACRVIACCQARGIATATVFSEPDRASRHVLDAGEAICIGPAPARESYLDIGKVLAAAKKCGADAIHPGYGFLSENAVFAAACDEAGLLFIGPTASAIRALGNKTAARQLVSRHGVPLVPGVEEPIASAREGLEAAGRIGFPVLIKAAAGGGGKGMRVVREPSDFASAFERAGSEAMASFGDSSIYVEKYLASPRHIEVQVMADLHGHAVYLGERECSVQRRHQKLLEETPSVCVTPQLRLRMGEAALAAVRAAGYSNLGTVEFLVDEERNFFFLEVNTRLQVEHPVTEAVTGLDLVYEQIRIAEGHELSVRQQDVQPRGHAIECRVSAEDPFAGFVPSPGRIRVYKEPRAPWVRVDTGIYAGYEVSLHYDPLLSKVIAWGPDRATAIERMADALRDYVIEGIRTSIPFHLLLLSNPQFVAGNLATDFIDRHMEIEQSGGSREHRDVAAFAAAWLRHTRTAESAKAPRAGSAGNWQLAGRPGGRRPWA
ncbi:MAG: acetyl-CoA carboxylase biotin carboxylase subunit [Candidatus Wallbacteria bacterium]|nr:acetyl-CoA carboxylase biotin carboxylase subunit [Candidatus Wallbacteria bacterium]